MRFIMTATGLEPTDGAIIPGLVEQAHSITGDVVLRIINSAAVWFVYNGIPIIAEGLLIWAMICLLIGITGHGKWIEKGARFFLFSILLGVVQYAV